MGPFTSSSYVDLLGLDSGRSSMDSFRDPIDSPQGLNGAAKGKGKELVPPLLLIDTSDAVATYLSTTNNPYSFSSPPSPPLISLRSSPMDFFRADTDTPPSHPNSPPEPPDPPSRPSSTSSTSSNPFSSPASSTLPRRKLLNVHRVPVTSLSFFPPPNPSFSSASSARSSFDDHPLPTNLGLGLGTEGGGANRNRSVAAGMADIGPLTNSLGRLAVPSPSTSVLSNARKGWAGVHWSKRWDISYFGGEEEEAGGAGAGGGDAVDLQEAEEWKLPPGTRRGGAGTGGTGTGGRRAVSEY